MPLTVGIKINTQHNSGCWLENRQGQRDANNATGKTRWKMLYSQQETVAFWTGVAVVEMDEEDGVMMCFRDE